MKKILKYSTILGVAGMLTAFSIPTASADTGGYTRFKVMDSHWNSLGFGNCGALDQDPQKKEIVNLLRVLKTKTIRIWISQIN